jgi:CHAD domain-containing protein
LRRLRSLMRVLGPSAGANVRKKHQRGLKDIGGSTSGTRDAEVQVEWLLAERQRLPPRDVVGVDWLLSRLERARNEGFHEVSRKVTDSFRRASRRLERALRKSRGERALSAVEAPFKAVLARVVGEETAQLLTALDATTGPNDLEQLHRTRILAKRLRYVLEPLRGAGRPAVSGAVNLLSELQDLLGELQDAKVLGDGIATALVELAAERARRAHAAIQAGATGGRMLRLMSRDARTRGLMVLDRRVTERTNAAYATLAREWLPSHRAELEWTVAVVAGSLLSTSRIPGAALRRFLLMQLPDGVADTPALNLEIGWLPGLHSRAWVARIDGPGATRYQRGAGGTAKGQVIAASRFATLWPQTAGHRLVKHRWFIAPGGCTWTLDVLGPKGPVLAETRSAEEGETALPKLLRSVLVREVTGEDGYRDERLAARRGLSQGDSLAIKHPGVILSHPTAWKSALPTKSLQESSPRDELSRIGRS